MIKIGVRRALASGFSRLHLNCWSGEHINYVFYIKQIIGYMIECWHFETS